jgi:PKHD-type hydroxylase
MENNEWQYNNPPFLNIYSRERYYLEQPYHQNQSCYLESAFTEKECGDIKKFKFISQRHRSSTFGSDPNTTASDVRESNNTWLPYNQMTQWLYERIHQLYTDANKLYNFQLDYFENFQLTNYTSENNHYSAHVDVGTPYDNTNCIRKLSAVVMLDHPESYEGGELLVYESSLNPVAYKAPIGTMLLFPSYMLHQVNPVTAGYRNSLVIWACGRPFK